MTENQENKLIIAYLQDVIAQMTAYKEYKAEDSQIEERARTSQVLLLSKISFPLSTNFLQKLKSQSFSDPSVNFTNTF